MLQGLLRCGRIMQTAYSGTKGNRTLCVFRAKQLYAGEHVCQRVVRGRWYRCLGV